MEMMKIFVFNMKKYRKKKHISQMKLAEMLDTSTSYIGEIEINSRVPSLAMVERIAKALNIEPFRLFLEDEEFTVGNTQETDINLECLSTKERQYLTKQIVSRITNEVEKILQPEIGIISNNNT
jgi:transcriptional regulator with XRE-family HTH domain